ncbi:uncharacterized protein [Littorina saxatilis]|uniref:Vitellogenin n=1 Tax=Littorina saxatilis TaxID=31220 RepID=A0AAN9BIU1_9CAEN
MKSFLLAIFVGLALASVDEDSFRRNRHYIYRYEAQLVTGAPQSSKLWSGLRLTANLNLYFLTDKRVTAILTEVNVQKIDRFVQNRSPSFFMMDEEQLLEGVQGDVNSVMIRQLELPFGFTWNKGSVEGVAFERNEPLWSSNIKRGVIGIFQVNLDRKLSLDPLPDSSVQFDPIMPSYTVWESTTFGYCRTTYTPKPEPIPNGFYLTKVRDYASCVKTSPMSLVFNNANKEEGTSTTKHLDMQGAVTYAIKGDKSNFIIWTAVGESKVVFTPYSYKQGNVQTSINQTVYLLTAKDIQNPRPPAVVARKDENCTLAMVMPINWVEDRKPYVIGFHSEMKRPISPWGIKKLDQLLTWVANATSAYPCKEAMMTMQTLMELIRQSKPAVLEDLMDRVISYRNMPANPLGPVKFKVYWDLLTTAGTTGCASVLLEKCLQDDGALNRQCISAVVGVGMYTPPSEVIISKLIMLLKKLKTVEWQAKSHGQDPKVKEIVMVTALSLGSIVGRAEEMVKHITRKADLDLKAMQVILDQNSAQDRLPELQNCQKVAQNNIKELYNRHHAIVNNFTQEIKKNFLEEDLDFNIILALKAFHNARVPATIPIIRHYLTKVQYNTVVRITAAQAFEKFVGEESVRGEVLNLLEMILKNPSDATAVRIQAFRTMLCLQAPVHTLIRVAQSLRFEKERQLTTYVFSMFQHIANVTAFEPYREAAHLFRSAMLFAAPLADAGVQDSYFNLAQLRLAPGASILNTLNYINTPRGVTVADASSIVNLFGTNNGFMKVQFISNGLERVIKKMFGSKGFFTERNSVFDLLRRTKRAADAKEMINDIFRKLAIKTREMPKVKAFFNIQMFNNDVRTYELTTFLQNIVNLNIVEANFPEATLRGGLGFNYKTSGIMSQFFTELPTEAGFPVSLQMGVTYFSKAVGSLNAAVDTSVYKDTRAYMPPRMIKAGLYINPQFSMAVMGKMAVDGYLLQTGSQFYSTVEYKSPFSINATFDLKHSHLALKISPPVNSQEPVLKFEIEPSVFCRVMPNNVSLNQLPINRRPVFFSMQPILVSNGAKVQNMDWSWSSKLLGYNIRVAGQPIMHAATQSIAAPLMGKGHWAIYVTPGPKQPPCIRADIRYFSKPRFVSRNSPKQGACDSWWTAFGFLCFGTDEESGVEIASNSAKPLPMAPPYSDFPNLYQHITFDSVKQKIEKRMGHAIHLLTSSSQWAFIATLNSSSPGLIRGASVQGLLQAWREGQFHESFITLTRTPLPGYDSQPWQMNMKASSLFPAKQFSLTDLLDPSYQSQANAELFSQMKAREHSVVNKYFQHHLITKISQDAMRRMPYLDPRLMLDRIMPEMILEAQDGCAHKLRTILQRLMPMCQQLTELKEEAKDAFKITRSQQLLLELGQQIPRIQASLMKLMKKIREKPTTPQVTVTATGYAVLKLSQAVFNMREIMQRATRLHLVAQPTAFYRIREVIERQQLAVYKLALIVLAPPKASDPMMNPQAASAGGDAAESFTGYAWSSRIHRYHPETAMEGLIAPSIKNPQAITPDVSVLIASLKRMTWKQLEGIHEFWQAVVNSRPISKEWVKAFLVNTARNVSQVNLHLQVPDVKENTVVAELLIQATLQHQIFVEMIHVIRYRNNTWAEPAYNLSNMERYALKVQTKQLMEWAYVLHSQHKLNTICGSQLPDATATKAMKNLQQHDRKLVALQQSHVNVPDIITPWTSDARSLRHAAWTTLSQALQECRTIRDALMATPKLHHPCLVAKLVETTVTLQQKIDSMKRILPAMGFQGQLAAKYQVLADQTMSFLLSLTPVFDKYVTFAPKNQPTLFPKGNVLISQGFLEVTMIRHQQNRINKQIRKFLFKDGSPSFDVVKRILENTAEKASTLKEKLEAEAPRVQNSMKTTTVLTAYSLLAQFTQALEEQVGIYDIIQQQLNLHAAQPGLPNMQAQIQQGKQKMGQLIKQSSSWTLPNANGPLPNANGPLPSIPGMDNADNMDYSYGWTEDQQAQPSQATPAADDMSMDAMRPIPVTFSDVPDMAGKMPRSPSPSQVVIMANITYTGQNYVGIQILGRKSVKQLLWETTQFFPQSRDSCVARAMKEKLAGRERLEICSRQTVSRINSFQHVHLQIDTNTNSMPGVQKFLNKIEHTYYSKSAVTKPQPFIHQGSVQAILELSHSMDSADTYLMTDKETLELQSIPLCWHVKAWNPLQNVAPVPRWAMMEYSNGRLPATCKVDRNNVRTSDGAVYRLPRLALKQSTAGCKTLLAMDCSVDKTFAISIKQNATTPAQALEILAEQHQVEIIPDFISDRVMVDGKQQIVKHGHPIVMYKTIAYGREAVALIISRRRGGFIHVEYPLVGLDILFDFSDISVDVSNVYKKQMCGLCGNYDGQKTLEMEGPQRQIFQAANDFFRSYIIPSNQCRVRGSPMQRGQTLPEQASGYQPLQRPYTLAGAAITPNAPEQMRAAAESHDFVEEEDAGIF